MIAADPGNDVAIELVDGQTINGGGVQQPYVHGNFRLSFVADGTSLYPLLLSVPRKGGTVQWMTIPPDKGRSLKASRVKNAKYLTMLEAFRVKRLRYLQVATLEETARNSRLADDFRAVFL